jgi:hypothetical protein
MMIPNSVAEQIRAAVLALDSAGNLPDRVGHAHSAIPLLADIGGAVLLRADGVVLELEWDQESEQHPRERPELASTVPLVSGAERYPWLKALLPQRPPDAVSCSTCLGGGSIKVEGGKGRVFCGVCGALGWVAVQPAVAADGAPPRR